CSFRNNRMSNFGKWQVKISSSWVFEFTNNILKGDYSSYINNSSLPSGLQLAYSKDPLFTGDTKVVNIPRITGNSFEFFDLALHWERGDGGLFTGNTFEKNEKHVDFETIYGLTFEGNYFEAGGDNDEHVKLGGFSAVGDRIGGRVVYGATIQGNNFQRNTKIMIYGLQNTDFKNNFY